MKKVISCLLVSLSLVGCATTKPPEQPVIVQHEYIVRIPPKEILTVPEPVKPLDTSKATQADVAQWIVDISKRSVILENNLKQVAEFLTKAQKDANTPPAKTEQKKD